MPQGESKVKLKQQLDRLEKRVDSLLAELHEVTKARDELRSRIECMAGPRQTNKGEW